MLDIREENIDRITEVFHLILDGKIPELIELPEDYPQNECLPEPGVNQLFRERWPYQ